MWEAAADIETTAPAEAVWALWENPDRWAEWNDQIAVADLDGPLAEGARARIRFRRSPVRLSFVVARLEPGRLFVDETRRPWTVMGHEHRVERQGGRTLIRNRLYVHGPAERLWVALMGRGMRSSVRRFVERERELAEAAATAGRPGETSAPMTSW